MANEIRTKMITKATFTCTIASLANGNARQSDMIANSNNYPAALVFFKIKSGAAAPTAGASYDIYLLRGNDSASSDFRTDGAGASDAAITIQNAKLLGSIFATADAATNFYGSFDTSQYGPLGSEWGIAVKNSSGQALDSTEGNHYKGYRYYVPEVQ